MSCSEKTESQGRRCGILRRHWIAIALLACALLGPEARAQNVLVVIADDLGVDGVAAYGESPSAGPTPVIDSLAAGGVLFRNFWSQPLCSPTRASLLTGLHPMEHGLGGVVDASMPEREIGLDASLPNLASMLAAAGYRSFALGKCHLAGGNEPDLTHPLLMGFDHHAGTITPMYGRAPAELQREWRPLRRRRATASRGNDPQRGGRPGALHRWASGSEL